MHRRQTIRACLVVAALAAAPGLAHAQLVAHWTFDEVSGTTATESVGGNHGTLVNFPGDNSQWQPGVFGNALRFDGVNDYVVHSFNLPRARGTIAHWLNPAVVGTQAVSVYESNGPAGAIYDGFGDPAAILEIHSGVGNQWQARYQDGDGSSGNNAPGLGRFASSEGAALANTWTHVAMTWDTEGDLVLYVNCQEVGRESMAAGAFDGLTTTERFIGRPSAATRFWNGLIDDVRIYDEPLTLAEILTVAQGCSSPVPTLPPTALVLLATGLATGVGLLMRRRSGTHAVVS